ncbi:NADPH-dependent FMN reductase [Frondihabitans sp. PAMC 28766]|uniref:NADPH-dependent FMN reductase n=1 Tax=Frondihabitans sp. PAMC 28766 TaxID=1795630 RepID=UPI00078BBFA8|nr:NAD(P)H-dependent oxidoreductase [Frondihabitans sp. PAMC 28766]AMM19039.1 NADPH-dependent FMN reductase [Frondihabitans sp. PAMC 28766]
MTKIAIIIGSTRPGRNGKAVADWAYARAAERTDAEFELVDLRDFPLPHYDEEGSPARSTFDSDQAVAWTSKVAEFDGYVFVTPEYNHSTTGVLKNALDYVYTEWNNKAAAFISYGGAGGARAVEHLRLVASELMMATVRGQVALSLLTDFTNFTEFTPAPYQLSQLDAALDQVVAWSGALAPLRVAQPVQA